MTTTVPVQPKEMWRSKTVWANLIVALLAIIAEIQDVLPAFADILVLPVDATRWLLLVAAILNIVLRRISDQPARFTHMDDPVDLPGYQDRRFRPRPTHVRRL